MGWCRRAHIGEVLTLVVSGTSNALSAAKRYRLRCLKPLIVTLAGAPCCPAAAVPGV